MGLVWMPWLVAAIGLRWWHPEVSAIPLLPALVRRSLGAALCTFGLAFWGWSAVHFIRHFSAGRLLTSGPFAWCRNPIYASFIVLLLPAAALLADAWPLLAADLALYLIFLAFIGEEDRALAERFGEVYQTYRRRVGAVLPVPPWHRHP